MSDNKKTTKNHPITHERNGSTLPKDEKTCARLRLMGALMALASVLMALLPLMYSGVYRYVETRAGIYVSNFGITCMIISGFIVALLYFLLALYTIRAGEHNTRLVRGVYQFNIIMTFCAIVAGILLFLPWPVPTFKLMMTHMATAEYIQPGITPMFIMVFVDMSLIIGFLASVSGVSYTCLIDKEDKK